MKRLPFQLAERSQFKHLNFQYIDVTYVNVIVIMLDSLRPDHLGFYGNRWIKTPNLDRFARESTVFERAYAEGMPTLPVRTALFTGRYTLMRRGWQHLEPEDLTLAEVLWRRGYDTALITDTAPMHYPRMAYERGFDYVEYIRGQLTDPYITDYSVKVDLSKWSPKNYLTDRDREDFIQYLRNRSWWRGEEDHFIARVVKAGIRWLRRMVEEGRRDKLFLWLDAFDPHEPWDPPEQYYRLYEVKGYEGPPIINPSIHGKRGGFVENFTLDEVRHIRAQYAGEVTLVDKWVGLLLEEVKNLGLWGNSLVILLSDHGEPLGEHDIIRKVRPWPYEELSRIVLAIHHPEGAGKGNRIRSFALTVDIFPTILDFLGISLGKGEIKRSGVEGLTLKPLIEEQAEEFRLYAIAGHYGRSWSIRDEEHSLYLWPLKEAPYTFGFGVLKEHERLEPELYKIDRSYIPSKPSEWGMGEEAEKDNIIEENEDLAVKLELKLRRELIRIT